MIQPFDKFDYQSTIHWYLLPTLLVMSDEAQHSVCGQLDGSSQSKCSIICESGYQNPQIKEHRS